MSKVNDKHYFESLANELDSKLGRINSLISNHPLEKGNYHEYILRDLISKFLPKRYSVKTGFIFVDSDHISPQVDLMIIDENQAPCILAQYDNFIVTYPEAVCCVIEIKTHLDKFEFKKSTDLIQKVKVLSKFNNPSGEVIGGLIFAFDSIRLSPKVLDGWYKSNPDRDLSEYPNAILSFKQGLVMNWNLMNKNRGHYFVLGDENGGARWKSLSIFTGTIIKFCELRAGINRPLE